MTLCKQAAAKLGLKIELKNPGGQKRKRASAKIKDTLPFYMSVQLNVDPAKLGQPVSRPRTYTWFFLTSVFDLDKHVSFADLFECPLVATGDAFWPSQQSSAEPKLTRCSRVEWMVGLQWRCPTRTGTRSWPRMPCHQPCVSDCSGTGVQLRTLVCNDDLRSLLSLLCQPSLITGTRFVSCVYRNEARPNLGRV